MSVFDFGHCDLVRTKTEDVRGDPHVEELRIMIGHGHSITLSGAEMLDHKGNGERRFL